MNSRNKLFRSLVVLGASWTGGIAGCGTSNGVDANAARDAASDAAQSESSASSGSASSSSYPTIQSAPFCENGGQPPSCAPPDAGGNDAGVADASPMSDGAAPGDAADAGGCGACTASQVCVQQSCGGGTAPPCDRLDDAGGCPAGGTYSASCNFITPPSAGPGCRPPPCVDPPPFCADIPSSCGSTPTCACFDSVCQSNGADGQSCLIVTGGKVSCGSG